MFEILAAANIRLKFESYCLSACAHFLFLPAEKPFVSPGTLIAFHHTTLSQAALRARPDTPDKDRFASVVLDRVNSEMDFYARRGLSRWWLIEPLRRMEPTCLYRDIDWTDAAHPKLGYESKYQYWIPSREMIETAGKGPFSGFWPETQADAQALINRVSPAVFLGQTNWFGPVAFLSSNVEDVDWVEKLPFCEAAKRL